jgi:late competence protein required for DNA uptake (superfamily II DNA/RNA helicase)
MKPSFVFTKEHYMKSKLNRIQKQKLSTITTEVKEECAVCFEDTVEFVQLECNHFFCESCINKIRNNNQIKCPLCRNRQMNHLMDQCNLSEKDKKTILDEFIRTEGEYRIFGKNYIPFDLIIRQIAEKNGIKIKGV